MSLAAAHLSPGASELLERLACKLLRPNARRVRCALNFAVALWMSWG